MNGERRDKKYDSTFLALFTEYQANLNNYPEREVTETKKNEIKPFLEKWVSRHQEEFEEYLGGSYPTIKGANYPPMDYLVLKLPENKEFLFKGVKDDKGKYIQMIFLLSETKQTYDRRFEPATDFALIWDQTEDTVSTVGFHELLDDFQEAILSN